MAFFSSVPIVDVHKDNFKSLWPSLILAIKSSSYISMDAELSGLGNRKNLLTRSMEDRYQSLAGVARTRSVLSLGISCFKVRGNPPRSQSAAATENSQALGFLVQTYNITTLCSEDYTVEPGSLKFLVDHGFDFNKQYASGVPYHRGLDKDEEKAEGSQTLRALFSELIKSHKPVVFHNGLVDLVFLYQNLYSELPASSPNFISDLCEMFPGGIFDTKYLAEFEARMQASYLGYVFRKSQRGNARLATCGRPHVALEFCRYEENLPFVGYHHCALPPSFTDHREGATDDKVPTAQLCGVYAAHGHCKNGIRCPLSHDPDAIQDADDDRTERRKRKRKRRKHRHSEDNPEDAAPDTRGDKDESAERSHGNMETGGDEDAVKEEDGTDDKDKESDHHGDIRTSESVHRMNQHQHVGETACKDDEGQSTSLVQDTGKPKVPKSPEKLAKQTGGHRAGYDAFMTGFAMASLALTIGGRGSSQLPPMDAGEEFTEAFHLSASKNKLFLSAKPVPLLIARSGFAKTSQTHRDKMKRLGGAPS